MDSAGKKSEEDKAWKVAVEELENVSQVQECVVATKSKTSYIPKVHFSNFTIHLFPEVSFFLGKSI